METLLITLLILPIYIFMVAYCEYILKVYEYKTCLFQKLIIIFIILAFAPILAPIYLANDIGDFLNNKLN